jgi:hypothetical protein
MYSFNNITNSAFKCLRVCNLACTGHEPPEFGAVPSKHVVALQQE